MKGRIILILLVIVAIAAGSVSVTSGYFSDREIASNNPVRVITDWYDLGWHWRTPLIISNSGISLTNYQLKMTLNTLSLVAAGKMQITGSDIRFTTSNGVTGINYWIDSGINTASTVLWVKVPSIPTGISTIYLYYGNPVANEVSSGDGTFIFFDDFENGFTPGLKWTVLNPNSGTVSLSTNAFRATRSLLVSDPPNGSNIGVTTSFPPQTQCVVDYAIFFQLQGTKEIQVQDIAGNIGPRGGFAKSKAGTDILEYYTDDWTTIGNFPAGVWYQGSLKMKDASTPLDTYDLYFYNNAGALIAQATDLRYYNNADLSVLGRFAYLGTSNFKTDTYLDLIKVRSYTNLEPSYSLGVEE